MLPLTAPLGYSRVCHQLEIIHRHQRNFSIFRLPTPEEFNFPFSFNPSHVDSGSYSSLCLFISRFEHSKIILEMTAIFVNWWDGVAFFPSFFSRWEVPHKRRESTVLSRGFTFPFSSALMGEGLRASHDPWTTKSLSGWTDGQIPSPQMMLRGSVHVRSLMQIIEVRPRSWATWTNLY